MGLSTNSRTTPRRDKSVCVSEERDCVRERGQKLHFAFPEFRVQLTSLIGGGEKRSFSSSSSSLTPLLKKKLKFQDQKAEEIPLLLSFFLLTLLRTQSDARSPLFLVRFRQGEHSPILPSSDPSFP